MAGYYLEEMREAAVSGNMGAGRAAEQSRNAALQAGGMGKAVSFDDLYLLARVIDAMAGSDWLTDDFRMCVGEVVLNRVASERFPNSVHDVVYQAGQFDPVRNGSIHNTPSDDAVLASYLCLEGVNTVGDALFFQNPSSSGVIFSGLTYIATIGDHVFYR